MSLVALCCHILALRQAELRTTTGNVVPEFKIVRDEALKVRERLANQEEFARLNEATKAIETGYYSFLSKLSIVCWWLYRESEDSSHVKEVSQKQLKEIQRQHKKALDEIVLPDWAEKELTESTFTPQREPRRSRSETDLPTKQMVMDVTSAVFPKDYAEHFPQVASPPPTTVARIWKDAGLSWLPSAVNGVSHPCLARRKDSLRKFIADLELEL